MFNHSETIQNLMTRLGVDDESSEMIEFARLVKIGKKPIYKNFYEMNVGYYPEKSSFIFAVSDIDHALMYFNLMTNFYNSYRR